MLQAALSVALTYVPHNYFNRIISLAFSLREASPLVFLLPSMQAVERMHTKFLVHVPVVLFYSQPLPKTRL